MGHDEGQGVFEEYCGRLVLDELMPHSWDWARAFHWTPRVMTLKRLIDVVGSLVGLILLAPLFGLIAVLIKADSPGPVLYRQTRVGLQGTSYVLLKYRSMYQHAEVDGARWADISDCRITRVGRWLRKLHLDELPQLVNVLQGHMSLVGPRPERPQFVRDLRDVIPFYDLRHTVPPGITGWAQICFPYSASIDDSQIKLQYDLYYVKNHSFWLDCLILIRTVRVVLLGSGAR